ncbi:MULTISPECIES: DUF2790 domain-containing protein [Pseudomonas]|uniref:DUF2790 domain-containing protein n=1 Tax=Pseudomonas segetis TaxID=298908 RepID=A0A238ZPQ6_9PSED|nr:MULTISPECIES: DUF2790 domain-containing protein [Pseudomonas]SNR85169.1 Protein of unknown function [Pseudomonas segetis]
MKASIALAAALLSLAPAAFASTSNAAKVDPVQYQYGTELDVAKVISLTDVSQQRGVVPVTMVYKDSEGNVHKLQFLQLGGANSSG